MTAAAVTGQPSTRRPQHQKMLRLVGRETLCVRSNQATGEVAPSKAHSARCIELADLPGDAGGDLAPERQERDEFVVRQRTLADGFVHRRHRRCEHKFDITSL